MNSVLGHSPAARCPVSLAACLGAKLRPRGQVAGAGSARHRATPGVLYAGNIWTLPVLLGGDSDTCIFHQEKSRRAQQGANDSIAEQRYHYLARHNHGFLKRMPSTTGRGVP